MSDSLTTLEVGKPLGGQRREYPEGMQYSYDRGGHQLLGFMRRPREPEVRDWKSGRAEFAVAVEAEGDVIVFLSRFGNQPWCDAVFNINQVAADRRVAPAADLEAERREIVQAILVDAADGTVRALRVVTVPAAFLFELNRALDVQRERPFTPEAYAAAVDRVFESYTTDSLVARARTRARGGA